MKDKLRELAERWKSASNLAVSNCGYQLRQLLDAEGDGGAIAVVRRLMTPEGLPYGDWDSLCKSPLPEEMARDGWSYQVAYLHPERPGVVSDEEMNRCERLLTACTCHADFKDRDMVDPQCCACELGDEVIDTFRAMRSAIAQEKQS